MLEKAMAAHSSTLAWKIPWMEQPGRLQSMGSLRVRHDWATSLSLFTFKHWRRKWQPLQCSCLENPRDGGAWWAAVYGVAQSRTWLKRLSRSSSSSVLSQAEIWECSCRLSYRNDYQSKLTGWIQVGKQSWVGERSEGWDQKELISVQCQVQTGATRRTRF